MRHMQHMDDVHAYAEGKAGEVMDLFRHAEHVHVVLDHERHRYSAEIVVQAGHYGRIEATESLDDLRAAIDAAHDKVVAQCRRLLDKQTDHHPAMKFGENRRERGEAT